MNQPAGFCKEHLGAASSVINYLEIIVLPTPSPWQLAFLLLLSLFYRGTAVLKFRGQTLESFVEFVGDKQSFQQQSPACDTVLSNYTPESLCVC